MPDNYELLKNIQSQAEAIKIQLQSGGIGAALKYELMANEKALQDWYSKLMASAGILTPEEKVKLEQQLDTAKKNELQAKANKTKRTMTIILIGVMLITVAGVIIYIKAKR